MISESDQRKYLIYLSIYMGILLESLVLFHVLSGIMHIRALHCTVSIFSVVFPATLLQPVSRDTRCLGWW